MKELLRVLTRRIPVIVICGVIGALIAVVFAFTGTSSYRATATLFASTAAQDVTAAYQGNLAATARVQTYKVLATGPELLVRAAQASGTPVTGGELSGKLAVEVPPGTVLLNIAVTDTSESTAAALSQAVADQLIAQVTSAERPLGGGRPSLGLIVLQPARAGIEHIPAFSPTKTIAAAIGGLIVGFLGALLIPGRIRLRRRTVHHQDEGEPQLPDGGTAALPGGGAAGLPGGGAAVGAAAPLRSHPLPVPPPATAAAGAGSGPERAAEPATNGVGPQRFTGRSMAERTAEFAAVGATNGAAPTDNGPEAATNHVPRHRLTAGEVPDVQ